MKTITFTLKNIETQADVKAHKLNSIDHQELNVGSIILVEQGVEGFGSDIKDSCKTIPFMQYNFEGAPKADELVKKNIDGLMVLMMTPPK